MFQRNPDEFLRRFITVDEMDPLLHIQDEGTVKTMDFIEWISSEKEDHKPSAGKMMATAFGMHTI